MGYPGAIVPPLPEKQAVSRFSPEFVESRRRSLSKFLSRVSSHSELVESSSLASFLSADDVAFTVRKSQPQAGEVKSSTSVMKWFNETKTSLSKDLIKTEDDEKFKEIQNYVETLENQMKTVVKHTQSLVKKGKETATGLFEFGLAFTLLGQSEASSLGSALTLVGHTADSLSVLSAEQAEMENEKFENPMIDYIRIIGSVKEALGERKKKLVSYSTSVQELSARKSTLEKAQSGGQPEKVAQAEESVGRAEGRMKEEERIFNETNERCLREVERFKSEKAADMKKTVLDYINLQIEFNKRMEETWTKLVP
eukprot:CAMPEP_0182491636 /NCGR_PEP_ID=MMETSP1321-20130603/986_1 /TAXON_ID=91990 /ORGANISM="Bolidomonas sp., Strain RCC1657" /LENGTH=310 /DNA_ID=CAMNT_0024693923 /DNA_START=217 /DNA_END=1146 /DNA_ORIENTATION=-